METALTTATWFWLFVPIPACVILAVITYALDR